MRTKTYKEKKEEARDLIDRGIDYANPSTTWEGINLLIKFKLKQKLKEQNK